MAYLQCVQGEVAELVDATRELGTLLFTGLEIQWLQLYRFESDLLHEIHRLVDGQCQACRLLIDRYRGHRIDDHDDSARRSAGRLT